MKRIEIVGAPDGRTSVETKGFAGADCRAASKFLEQSLGRRTGETLTGEYHQSRTTAQAERARN